MMVDSKNRVLVLIVYGAASSISINTFFPADVKSFGKSNAETLLLTTHDYAARNIPWLQHRNVGTSNTIHRMASKRAAAAAFSAVSTIFSIYRPYLYPQYRPPVHVGIFVCN